MKKIIIAVASVLALGLLASCKQEISGTITTNTHSLDLSSTTKAYFTIEGTYTTTTDAAVSTKALNGTDTKVSDTKTVVVYSVQPSNNTVTLEYTVSPTNNEVLYKYTLPTFDTTTKTTAKSYSGTTTTTQYSESYSTADLGDNGVIKIKSVGGKYYYQANTTWVVLENFNPLADSIDFAKVANSAYSTTGYTGRAFNAEGTELSYTTKTVTSYSADASTFKLAKK